jgi:hypothetical protein
MNLDSAIPHIFNGQYYLYRYIFTGYGQPEMPFGASEEASVGRFRLGAQSMLILFDNNYFYDWQWKKV